MIKKWAITLGIGLGISLIALIMAIFDSCMHLAVRRRDAMYRFTTFRRSGW